MASIYTVQPNPWPIPSRFPPERSIFPEHTCNDAWLRTCLSQSVWRSLEHWCFCRGEGWLGEGALS